MEHQPGRNVLDKLHNEMQQLNEFMDRSHIYAGCVGYLISYLPDDRINDFLNIVRYEVRTLNKRKNMYEFLTEEGDEE